MPNIHLCLGDSISITLPSNPTITEIIDAARLYRAKQLGWSAGRHGLTIDEWLVGSCVENADTLATVVNNHTPYDAKIIKGALDYYSEPTPDTYKQAKHDGTLHHWVEITTNTDTLICNLYSEALADGDVYPDGGPLITDTLPQNYITFD